MLILRIWVHRAGGGGLVSRPEDWRWSSYNEYVGMSAEEQNKRWGLIVDRERMPCHPRVRI